MGVVSSCNWPLRDPISDLMISNIARAAQHCWRAILIQQFCLQGRINHSAMAEGPPLSGGSRGHLLNSSYHITYYNYGSIRVWRRIELFYQIAPVLKSTGHFYKRGALIQGHKIGCLRLEHLLNFTLRYGYSLWYDVIFVDINVLDLALWAEKILKLNVFLCNF